MTSLAPAMAGDTLLPLVLEAQQRSSQQLSAAHLSETAARLVRLAESLDCPLLMPVSREAERLVGAALLVGMGRINAADAATYLTDSRVLLVDAVVVQTAALASAAYYAKRAGAEVVGAAVLDQLGSDAPTDLDVHSLTCP